MTKQRNSLSNFLRWLWRWLFGDDDFDQDPPEDKLAEFRGDLYEDLREEITDSIVDNQNRSVRYKQIALKIELGLKLTDDEQRDTGITQF